MTARPVRSRWTAVLPPGAVLAATRGSDGDTRLTPANRSWTCPRSIRLLLVVASVLPGITVADPLQAADLFAPAVGADAMFLAGYTKREDPDGAPTSRTGLFAQDLEVHAATHLDAGTVAVVTVDLPRGSRTVDRVELGETYLTTALSSAWQVQAGRFNVDFGRHNRLHAHQRPFLDGPLALERAFGPDGIQEVGVGLRGGLPLPWDAGLCVQITNGDNRLWVNPTDEDLLYVLHLRNGWRRDESLRVELGGSWAGGRNPVERWTYAKGIDLTVQAGGATWQSEYVRVDEDLKRRQRASGGLSSFVQVPVAPRWRAQARYDYYGLPSPSGEGWEDRATVLLAFVPSAKASVRFQYSRWRVDTLGRGFNQYHFQLRFAIGAHDVPTAMAPPPDGGRG